MNINEERAAKGRRPLASAEDVAAKWRRATTAAAPKYAEAMAAQDAERYQRQMLSMLGRIDYHLAEINSGVGALAAKLDHIHGDVTAVRETLSIQRPECYGPAKRAPRRRRAPTPDAAPDAKEPESGTAASE